MSETVPASLAPVSTIARLSTGRWGGGEHVSATMHENSNHMIISNFRLSCSI